MGKRGYILYHTMEQLLHIDSLLLVENYQEKIFLKKQVGLRLIVNLKLKGQFSSIRKTKNTAQKSRQ